MENELTDEQLWRKYRPSLALHAAGASFMAVAIAWFASTPRNSNEITWTYLFFFSLALLLAGNFLGNRYLQSKSVKNRLEREFPAKLGRALLGGGIGAGLYFFPAPPPIFDGHALFLGIMFGALLGVIAHFFALYEFKPDPSLDGEEGVAR